MPVNASMSSQTPALVNWPRIAPRKKGRAAWKPRGPQYLSATALKSQARKMENQEWLISQMHVLQDLSEEEQQKYLDEASIIDKEAAEANAAGKAAGSAWPGVAIRLDTGGYGFFSQLGVVRRPDLTQYFIDGFAQNRDGVVFTTESQTLFTEVFGYINS